MPIHIRHIETRDAGAWQTLRALLWPEEGADALAPDVARFLAMPAPRPIGGLDAVLVAVDRSTHPETVVGFAELSRRPYAEGCESSPVAFLEGWYVLPDYRRRGVGRALVRAAESWGRAQGCREFGSDALADNTVSAAAHRALGFEDVEVTRAFRKDICAGDDLEPSKLAPDVTTILWRRIDNPGHDAARLWETPDERTIEGTAVFREEGRSARLDYHVLCDASWRTQEARVTGWMDASPVELVIAADELRHWTLNGQPCPQVSGCEDVDLSFTPATNLLPIRRLALGVGERAAVRSAWLRFPALTLQPLDQSYERVSDTQYHYASDRGAFTATLDVSPAGLVTRYSGLWEVE